MRSCKLFKFTFLSILTLLTTVALVSATPATVSTLHRVSRPPQFIALAFDGSKSIQMWNETRQFASANRHLHFTYFISGVYFLTHENRQFYNAPRRGLGFSNIGFGHDRQEILERIHQVNLAHSELNEIGSHANGHFDGSTWNAENWTSEFEQFNQLVFHPSANNQFGDGESMGIMLQDIVGFRAPYLARSDGLWPTLQAFHYRYDTSRTGPSNYWPQKMPHGFWNFPLADLRIAGSGLRTLSMDYNFYYAHSHAQPDAAHSALYEQQTLDTYTQWFEANYNGNRAPISIGHHFDTFNAGAYWRALKRFADRVCNQPEVRCVSYRELADFMESVTPSTRQAYQAGGFDRGPRLSFETPSGPPLNVALALRQVTPERVEVVLSGSDSDRLKAQGLAVAWTLDGNPSPERPAKGLGSTNKFNLAIKSSDFKSDGSPSRLSAEATLDGKVIARTTHLIIPARSGAGFELSSEDLEDLSLNSDLPEAHNEE